MRLAPCSEEIHQDARDAEPGRRTAHNPSTTGSVSTRQYGRSRPVRRAGHAHCHHLQLDLPRLGHRPPRPGSKSWIITADDQQIRERGRRARPTGFYTRARCAQPQHEPDKEHNNERSPAYRYQRWAASNRHRSLYVRVCRKSGAVRRMDKSVHSHGQLGSSGLGTAQPVLGLRAEVPVMPTRQHSTFGGSRRFPRKL